MLRNALVFTLIGTCLAIGTALGASTPERVTVCEVIANPSKYDGKMILLEGEIFGTDEGGWLVAPNCPTPFVTAEHVWPNSIFLQGDLTYKYNLHEVKFAYDYASERRAVAKARDLERRFPGRKLLWAYEGLLETRTDWELHLAKYPNGTTKYIGFGHLGEACAQLIMKAIHDVSVAP